MDADSRILVTGGSGFLGRNFTAHLKSLGHQNVRSLSSKDLDLCDFGAVKDYFGAYKPEYCFFFAGLVGGIKANSKNPIEFYTKNSLIAINSFRAAELVKPKKCLYLGSSCIYPKFADQPFKEEALLTGSLEPTNEAYALAKIGGVKLASHYHKSNRLNIISAMPPNIYGPGDNFDLEDSHVLSALVRRYHEAKCDGSPFVTLWGTGSPLREFIYVDDLSRALTTVMNSYDGSSHINVGSAQEVSISRLAMMVKEVVGYEGEVLWDDSMPDGFPRKMMDNSKLFSLGFSPQVSLLSGISKTYESFLKG